MSVPGREIFRCYDEWGAIRVLEEGVHRYLAFGQDTEQSCVLRIDPAIPVHQYIQGMLLALLFQPNPTSATVLGLGAGSLVNGLLAYDPHLEVTAVELRPQVAAVARQWFGFRKDKRLTLHIGDAGEFMAVEPPPCDLLMADIYSDQGMDDLQLNEAFLADCYHSLSEQGVLALNLWDDGKGAHPLAFAQLDRVFGSGCLVCPIDEGNLILYAFKGGPPVLNQRRLVGQAKRLSRQLNFPVSRLVERLREN